MIPGMVEMAVAGIFLCTDFPWLGNILFPRLLTLPFYLASNASFCKIFCRNEENRKIK